MKIFVFSLGQNIYWKIRRNDPLIQDLMSLPGCFFINPLTYQTIISSFKRFSTSNMFSSEAVFLLNDLVVVSTDIILLGISVEKFDPTSVPFYREYQKENTSQFELKKKPSVDWHDILLFYIEHLLPNLRHESKQVRLSKNVPFTSLQELLELPNLSFPEATPETTPSGAGIQKYILDTAVTWKHLINADIDLLNLKKPIYEELLLDAIHAYQDEDYRRSLLYTAIAAETLSATKLDEAYKLLIKNGDPDKILRLVSLPQRGGSSIVKDPVYELLLKKSRFLELLHEVPLYILGKSLSSENHTLYQKAVKLYRTRNEIAHSGTPPTGNQAIFALTRKDALEAIECAKDIFQWFKVSTEFPTPEPFFINGSLPL